MKKLKNTLFLIIFLISGLSFFVLNYKTSLVEQLISKHLNDVPIYLEKMEITKNVIKLNDFFIGNFSKAKTGISFIAKEIAIKADLTKLMKNLFTIDSLIFKDTTIAVELYNESGTKNNWESILKEIKLNSSIKKDYLIKKISLRNIKIRVTDHKGKITCYPNIDKLEFYNICSSSKFPINKIDKTVLKIIIKAIFTRIGLDDLLNEHNSNQLILPYLKITRRNYSPST